MIAPIKSLSSGRRGSLKKFVEGLGTILEADQLEDINIVNQDDNEIFEEVKDTKTIQYLNEEEAHKSLNLGAFEIWALGITIVIGGQYFSWNFALVAGSGSTYISVFLIGTAYLCLCLGNAELSSSLPFAGGAYGMSRVTLGFYPGFLIGMCETFEYILYVASSGFFLCQLIAEVGHVGSQYLPVMCLAFYISATTINITGGRTFWRITIFLAIVSFLILIIYCLGSLPFVNFGDYAASSSVTGLDDYIYKDQMFVGGMRSFMKTLPLAPWFYVGVESLNLASSVVSNVSISFLKCYLRYTYHVY